MSTETPRTPLNRFAPIAYSTLLVAAAVASRFAVLSNDAFPLRWQAEHLSLKNPESFYNGFFPIGYPILLRLVSFTHEPLAVLEILQALTAGLFALFAIWFFARYSGRLGMLIALTLTLFYPSVIRAVLSATPDFAVALAALLAFYAIAKRSYGIAGLALGIGSLFRTHMLALIVAVILALILYERDGRLMKLLRLCLTTIPFVLLQGFFQVWSGHDFFETSQAINVYRMMYGIDWSHPPTNLNAGVVSLIAHDPMRFASAYLGNLWSSAFAIIPILGVLIWQVRSKNRPTSLLVILTASLIYLLIVTIGYSPRAVVLVWPVVVLAITMILQYALRLNSPTMLRAAPLRWMVAGLLLVAIFATIEIFLGANHAAARVSEYTRIEDALNVRTPEEAQRIYTDDFGLYFPHLDAITPRTSGGWAEIGLPNYLEENPHLTDSTAEGLRASLLQNDLHTLIFRIPPINQRAYTSAAEDSTHFKIHFRTAHHAIYSVE